MNIWNVVAVGVLLLTVVADRPGAQDALQGVFGIGLAIALAYIGHLSRRQT